MATTKEFLLEIITPERTFYQGDVTTVELTTVDGQVGVLSEHVPTVFALQSGIIRFATNGRIREAALGDGFAEMSGSALTVLVQTAEWAHEIEEARVKEIIEKETHALEGNIDEGERRLRLAGLARAINRLKLKHRNMETDSK